MFPGKQARISLDRYFAILAESQKEVRRTYQIPVALAPIAHLVAAAPLTKPAFLEAVAKYHDDPESILPLLRLRPYAHLLMLLDLAERYAAEGVPHPSPQARYVLKKRAQRRAIRGAERSAGRSSAQ